MVLTPIMKASASSVIVASATASVRPGYLARQSETKLQLNPPSRSPWRMGRWPTSPVTFKRLASTQIPSSPVRVVKQFFSNEDDNQREEQTALTTVELSRNDSPVNDEYSLAARWRRRDKSTNNDQEPCVELERSEKPSPGEIDLVERRSSLASIRVQLDLDETTLAVEPVDGEDPPQHDSLIKVSLREELDEFRNSDEQVKIFPDYLSETEKELVKQVAERLRLGCQMGETKVTVFKTGYSDRRMVQNRMGSRSGADATIGDDVFVDVPSLAQYGKDGFIARLRLQRLSSGGGICRNMLWDVAQLSSADGVADPVGEGEGGVYAVQSRSSGKKLAMFKPVEEERFVREGIFPGEGAVREEAAYVLDSRCKGFSGVPATAVARLHLASIGQAKHGAVQRFMGSVGSMDRYGMPFDLKKAEGFVSTDQVHRIGVLDIRTFNTDRHPGNILLIGDKAPYTMVPIDHGCILPSWFHLSEARFDWLEYPQSNVCFSKTVLAHIESLDSDADATALRRLGIREECVTTLKICTMFLKLAARAGRTLHWIGAFMQRSGCFENPSRLELSIQRTCVEIGIPFTFVANDYGEQKSEVTLGIVTRRLPSLFFSQLENILMEAVRPS